MDGTIFEWRNFTLPIKGHEDTKNFGDRLLDVLYMPGYYYSLQPYWAVIGAIKELIRRDEIDLYIMSCALKDRGVSSPVSEKNLSLDKYLKEINESHRIFVPDGEDKTLYVPGGIRRTDTLVDDYTKNLNDWQNKGIGVKMLNDVNASNGKWTGRQVRYDSNEKDMADAITEIAMHNAFIRQENPEKNRIFNTLAESYEYCLPSEYILARRQQISIKTNDTANITQKDNEIELEI